jgi:H+/Cl- antiporter ClcA
VKKGKIAIFSGIMIGLIIAFFRLEYNGMTLIYIEADGSEQVVHEIDFNLVTDTFLIIVVSVLAMYLILSLINKLSPKQKGDKLD